MKNSYDNRLPIFFYFVMLLCLLQLIQKVSPEINSLITLSEDNFIYTHISINSNGDMVIDTSSLSSEERRLYGLKKNGSPFFGSSAYNTMSPGFNNSGRGEGEVFFVNYKPPDRSLNIKESLAYIPQKDTKILEYFLLDDNSLFSSDVRNSAFENIASSRFSHHKIYPERDINLKYVISFIRNNKLSISQGYFDATHGKGYEQNLFFEVDDSDGLMVSCYFTEKKSIFVFIYLQEYINKFHLLFLLIKIIIKLMKQK